MGGKFFGDFKKKKNEYSTYCSLFVFIYFLQFGEIWHRKKKKKHWVETAKSGGYGVEEGQFGLTGGEKGEGGVWVTRQSNSGQRREKDF